MRYGPRERVLRWQHRAIPIINRWVLRGRPVNSARIEATIELVMRIDAGDPACYSAENYPHSHHCKGCLRRRG